MKKQSNFSKIAWNSILKIIAVVVKISFTGIEKAGDNVEEKTYTESV